MTDRYVNPAVGSSGAGTSWATAYKTLAEATAAAAAGEKIYFANGTADVLTVDTTYTLAAGVTIISTSDTTNNPPTTYATGASVSSTTTGVGIIINGIGAVFGVSFASSTSGSSSSIDLANADNSILEFTDCTFSVPASATTQTINLGNSGSRGNTFVSTRNCNFIFARTQDYMLVNARWHSDGDTFCGSGSIPTTLFQGFAFNNTEVSIRGADLTNVNSTLMIGHSDTPGVVTISNSKLHASVTPLGATTNAASNEITLLDCSYMNGSTLTGKLFYHENHLGSTTISAAIYNNTSGDTIDGTTKVSWVVDGKAASTYATPYQSPWIALFNDTTTSQTPRIECMRDNASGAAYTDAQAWAEFEYRATADSPRFTLNDSDKCGPLATAANQASSSLGASDWAGETGTPWFGKLEPSGAITAAEVGYLCARVCLVGDITLYVDPKIHGIS